MQTEIKYIRYNRTELFTCSTLNCLQVSSNSSLRDFTDKLSKPHDVQKLCQIYTHFLQKKIAMLLTLSKPHKIY